MKHYKSLVRAVMMLLLLTVAFGAWAQDEAMSPDSTMQTTAAPAEAPPAEEPGISPESCASMSDA